MLWIMGLLYQLLIVLRDRSEDLFSMAFDWIWAWAAKRNLDYDDLMIQRISKPFKAALIACTALLCLVLASCVHGDPVDPSTLGECAMYYSTEWHWTDQSRSQVTLVPVLDSVRGQCAVQGVRP